MKAGLWQLVILGVLVLVFFRPVILTLVRVVARLHRENAERAQGTVKRRPSPAFTCPHCGARLPDDAEYCPRCGRRVGYIDV